MNFVRTSHYPPGNGFMPSSVTARGLYVTLETAVLDCGQGRTARPKGMHDDPQYEHLFVNQLRETVLNYGSHPADQSSGRPATRACLWQVNYAGLVRLRARSRTRPARSSPRTKWWKGPGASAATMSAACSLPADGTADFTKTQSPADGLRRVDARAGAHGAARGGTIQTPVITGGEALTKPGVALFPARRQRGRSHLELRG